MATSPLTFTGISRFSDDLQQILQRAARIASLPIQKMQLDQRHIIEQKAALGTLASAAGALTGSFASLGLLGARRAVAASTSNPSAAVATLTGAPDPLTYIVSVTSAATAAQAATSLSLADPDATPPRADGLYQLTVGTRVEDFDLLATGSGRQAGTAGDSAPASPVSVTVAFANGLSGSITASLAGFFVGRSDVSGAGPGDTVTVNFVSADGTINTGITTDPLAGGEDAAALAAALNAKIALNPDLAGKVSFTAAGARLKLIESDAAGQGFTFSSSQTGTIVTGLEGGGTIGGQSAQEIAAALNAQIALNSTLSAAGVTFTAAGGEVKATANEGRQFTFTVTDNAQGTGFASGLAGKTRVVGYANTLNGLRDYINSRETTLGVRAAVVNTSSDPASPRYDLSLVATSTGAQTLTLRDSSGTDLLPAADTLGSNAVFTLNGGTPVSNPSNTIRDLVAGLDLTITGPGTAVITVAKDRSAVKNALQDIADKYNQALEQVNGQIGEQAGVLSGSILVRQMHAALRGITGFNAGSGLVRSIADLGLELSKEGKLSLNEVRFNSLTDAEFSDAVSFLGSTTSGFAGNAYALLKQLTDPATGLIQSTQSFFDQSDQRLSQSIAEAQDRVKLMTDFLQARLGQADLLLARLEREQALLTGLFEEQRILTLSANR